MAVLPNITPNPIEFPREWVEQYELASEADRPNTTLGGIVNPLTDGSHPSSLGNMPEIAFTYDIGLPTNNVTPTLNSWGVFNHWNRVWGTLIQRSFADTPPAGNLWIQPVASRYDDFVEGDATPYPVHRDVLGSGFTANKQPTTMVTVAGPTQTLTLWLYLVMQCSLSHAERVPVVGIAVGQKLLEMVQSDFSQIASNYSKTFAHASGYYITELNGRHLSVGQLTLFDAIYLILAAASEDLTTLSQT